VDETPLPDTVSHGYVTGQTVASDAKAVLLTVAPDGKRLAIVTAEQSVVILGIAP
jgi:hypothetical protein